LSEEKGTFLGEFEANLFAAAFLCCGFCHFPPPPPPPPSCFFGAASPPTPPTSLLTMVHEAQSEICKRGGATSHRPSSSSSSASVSALSGLEQGGARFRQAQFDDLSCEVVMTIFSYLDPRTLACCCALVATQWRRIAHHLLRLRGCAHEDALLNLSDLYVGHSAVLDYVTQFLDLSDTPMVVTVRCLFSPSFPFLRQDFSCANSAGLPWLRQVGSARQLDPLEACQGP